MKILIVRLTSMGDVLFNLSVIADIKKSIPQASIDWVVDEEFGNLVKAHGGIDRVLRLPIRKIAKTTNIFRGLQGVILLMQTLLQLRKTRYEHVIDTQGVIKSAVVCLFSRGKHKWSYTREHLESPYLRYIYSHHLEPSRNLPAVFQYRNTIGTILGYLPDFSTTEFLFSSATNHRESNLKDQKDALLVPFSSKEKKQLSVDEMARIASICCQRGFSITLVAGSDSERVFGQEIASLAGCTIKIIFRPMENFDDFQLQLPKFSMCIGVDTGVTHVSAAFGVPTAGIFSASAINSYGPHHWAPKAVSLSAEHSELMLKIELFISQLSNPEQL